MNRRRPLNALVASAVAVWAAAARHGVPVASDGTIPFARRVVREKGKVELGNVSCAMCHTRVLSDGTAVAGEKAALIALLKTL